MKKNEIESLIQRIRKLEDDFKRKPIDDVNEAKNALAKCTEYKNRSNGVLDEINSIKTTIEDNFSLINQINDYINTHKLNIEETSKLSTETSNKIEHLSANIVEFESLYSNIDILKEKYIELQKIFDSASDLQNKTNAIYSSVKLTKQSIDELSYEIFGFDDDSGKHQDGLKDKLQKTYTSLSTELKNLKLSFDELRSENQKSIDELYDEYEERIAKFTSDNEIIYKSNVDKIKSLLPDALTAGLSHAYSEKRINEIKENKILMANFNRSILFLVLISLIPFGVGTYLLTQGHSLISTIEYLPRLIFSIAPLYAPVVWLAYYSNKKLNLSKRLIEEYTHKEVLSKTFEGLSTQIENLEDSQNANDLRTKLLYNILSVSSENPGKLISDYNVSDHPLMDALDKSVKLNDAIETISKIPGMSKLSNIIEKKANNILAQEEKKVEKGLEQIEKTLEQVEQVT